MSKQKLFFITLCLWMLSGASSRAQFGQDRVQRPFTRPTVSPYLNLFRNGNSGGNPVLNYYGLVRPQQQFYQQSEDLRMGVYNTPAAQPTNPYPQQRMMGPYLLGTTGHATSFRTFRAPRPQPGGISSGLTSPSAYNSQSAGRFGSENPSGDYGQNSRSQYGSNNQGGRF